MAPRKPIALVGNTSSELGPADTLMGAGFHNKLRNGNAAVNARGVSGTVTLAAGAYGHDGWKAGANGATYTFAASGIDTVISLSAGSLLQIVPGSDVEDTAYAASWAGSATGRLYQGSSPPAYAGGPVAAAGLTVGTNLVLELTGGTFTCAQVERGAAPTGFERRPLAAETTLCAAWVRVLQLTGPVWCGDGNAYGIPFTFADMRAKPGGSYVLNSSSNMVSGYPKLTIQSANSGAFTVAATSTTGILVGYNATVTLTSEL